MFISFSFYRLWICHFLFVCVAFSSWADLVTDTIYLTWQRHPDTTMTIQWISPLQQPQSIVSYCLKEDSTAWKEVSGETFKFPHSSRYLIHRVELQALQPNTDYLFKVAPYQKNYSFHTASSDLEQNMRFVVGGDMYHDGIQLMAKTCRQAALTNPLFALIGGDIAYAVESAHTPFQNVERWIEWIKTWHATMVAPNGNLIPVIAAIGNHDLVGHYDQHPLKAAIFSTLFPMPGKQIYNTLDFGSYLSLFLLDSGHANSISGPQAKWLQTALQERQDMTHRFAAYHVPAYPSCRSFHNRQSLAIRRSWVPLFEKGGIQTCFEHHDHAYKRTYPLLRNRMHPDGIVYLGDGAWGVERPRSPRLRCKPSFLAKFSPTRHFIVVDLTPSQQRFRSLNDQGKIIDDYSKSLKMKNLSAEYNSTT